MVVLDDLQWGEATFRDLDRVDGAAVDRLADLAALHGSSGARGAAPRVVGDAAARAATGGPGRCLIGDGVSEKLRERIARAAGGNPLFISEMLAMAAESDDVDVPPTLKALLACGSTSSTTPSGGCSSAARSRARSSTWPRRAGSRSRGKCRSRSGSPGSASRAHPSGPGPARRRGRLSLSAPPDPRRGLRRPPEGGSGGPAHPLCGVARRARTNPRRARRDRRLPPRAGRPLCGRARKTRCGSRGTGGAPARGRRQTCERPPGRPGRACAPLACSRASTADPVRSRTRTRAGVAHDGPAGCRGDSRRGCPEGRGRERPPRSDRRALAHDFANWLQRSKLTVSQDTVPADG